MALGSGSSLATDCWIMRGGSPSSEKALKVGSATRLHQHSSSKPTAHSGWAAATSISRSRRLFSFVQGIGGGDPPLGPLPAYAQKTPERGADGLPRDPLFGETLLEGGLGGHLQSPQATLIPELSRRAVEHPPQPLGRVRVEGGMHALWSRGASDERIQALLVEGADGVANRLGGAPETLGYLGRRAAAGAGEQYLAAAHHEGLPGAQPRFEAFALLFRQFPDKYWRFHKRNYSPSHTTLSEDALGFPNDEDRRRSLKDVAADFIGAELDKEEQTSDFGLEDLTDAQVCYSLHDAEILIPLKDAMMERLRDLGLEKVAELEARFLPALAYCENNGFALDTVGWREQALRAKAEAERLWAHCDALSPPGPNWKGQKGWNWRSAKQIGEVFKLLGVSLPKTDKGNDKTDESTLKGVTSPEKAVSLAETLLRLREQNKRASWGREWLDLPKWKGKRFDKDHQFVVNGRVHASFGQVIKTGRMRCS